MVAGLAIAIASDDVAASERVLSAAKLTALDYAHEPGIGWIRVPEEDRDSVINLLQNAGAVRKAK